MVVKKKKREEFWLDNITGNVLDCKSFKSGSNPLLAFLKKNIYVFVFSFRTI